MQGRARWEVGSQVEFPMMGTVLWEGQAGIQVLHPVGERSCPAGSTLAPETLSKPPTTGVTPRGEHGVPRATGGGKEKKRIARRWVVVDGGEPLIPHTPADVLVPKSSVQQED